MRLPHYFWRGRAGGRFFIDHIRKGIITYAAMAKPNRFYTKTVRAFLRKYQWIPT